MIKDESSGYGWGNGIMYSEGNPGDSVNNSRKGKLNVKIKRQTYFASVCVHIKQVEMALLWRCCQCQETTKMAG